MQYGKSMKAATATGGCGRAAHVVLEGTAGPQEQLHGAPLVASPFGLCLQPLRGLQVVYVQAGLQHLHISARARQAPRLASVPSSLSRPWAQQAVELCAFPVCIHRVAPETYSHRAGSKGPLRQARHSQETHFILPTVVLRMKSWEWPRQHCPETRTAASMVWTSGPVRPLEPSTEPR